MGVPVVGMRLERELLLDAAAIRAGAAAVGDFNPLHHDGEFAARSRFGELIASGAYTSAVLAGLISEGFGVRDGAAGNGGGAVGVEFAVRFVGPARVGRRLLMSWEVVETERRRRGVMVRLEGRTVDMMDGGVVLSALMGMLYLD